MEAATKVVAIYARVSTDKQDTGMQVQELTRFVEARGWSLPDDTFFYIDRGISGKAERRPELDRMMKDARRRRFSAVVVWKFDRFARSVRHLVTALEEFQSLGVDFCSLHEQIDTSTPMGKFFFQLVAAFAEFEREVIRARINAGIAEARRKGVRLGRPAKKCDVKKILMLRVQQKLSWTQCAKAAGVSLMVVRRRVKAMLNQETIAGVEREAAAIVKLELAEAEQEAPGATAQVV